MTHPLLMIFLEPMSGTHTHFPESCGENWPFLASQESRNRGLSHLEDIPEESFLPCLPAVPVRGGRSPHRAAPCWSEAFTYSHSVLPLVKRGMRFQCLCLSVKAVSRGST